MYILGITGSMATGKTTVANMFADAGHPTFHADETVHDLFKTSKRLRSTLAQEFPGVVKGDNVDRAALAKKVFGKPDRLTHLEHLIHPFVFRALNKFLRFHRAKGAQLVVLDIPLLFETRAEDICDGVLVVTTDAKTQKRRAMKRENFSEEGFQGRLARQMSVEEKVKRADFVIDTATSQKETRKEVEKLIAKLGF